MTQSNTRFYNRVTGQTFSTAQDAADYYGAGGFAARTASDTVVSAVFDYDGNVVSMTPVGA